MAERRAKQIGICNSGEADSFSKVLFSVLRVGYLVIPEQNRRKITFTSVQTCIRAGCDSQ
jgi:hypothetical protein